MQVTMQTDDFDFLFLQFDIYDISKIVWDTLVIFKSSNVQHFGLYNGNQYLTGNT